MNKSESYSLRLETPSIETYRNLRVGSGLSGKTTEAAERGLPNTLFAVQILLVNSVVGMGRVIGDGGCFYQVCSSNIKARGWVR